MIDQEFIKENFKLIDYLDCLKEDLKLLDSIDLVCIDGGSNFDIKSGHDTFLLDNQYRYDDECCDLEFNTDELKQKIYNLVIEYVTNDINTRIKMVEKELTEADIEVD